MATEGMHVRSVVSLNRPNGLIGLVKGEGFVLPFTKSERAVVTDSSHTRSSPAYSASLKQQQTVTRNGGTPGLLSYNGKMTLLVYESVPTNATRKRIAEKAKAWGNAQDRLT